MKKYLSLLSIVKSYGKQRHDRTGTGTRSLFGEHLKIDLSEGFPLLTTKKMFWKGIVHELLWLLNGDTNIKYLVENDVHIWDDWADKEGNLGPIYGKQWRAWAGHDHIKYDQISLLIEQIKSDPSSRRMVVSSWNVSDLTSMILPPCHTLFQFYVHDNKISCHLYQRSSDAFLGLPFNIAEYALLTHMVGHVCGLTPESLIISFGDIHIYNDHVDAVFEQLRRVPRPLPELRINRKVDSIFDFKYEDFDLIGYSPHGAIKAKVSV